MPPATPRPAATIVLVRPASRGSCEVYLQKRADTLRFAPGFHVFPGGALDREDEDPALLARLEGGGCWGAGDGVTPAHVVAALRECYEESGVLLACDAAGRPAHADLARAARLAEARAAVEGPGGLAALVALLDGEGLRLAGDAVRYFSHWITPSSSPVRFDTRFFLAPLPEGATPAPCSGESVEGAWWDPEAALAAYRSGVMRLLWPTETTLRFLRQFDAFEEIICACDDAGLKIEGVTV